MPAIDLSATAKSIQDQFIAALKGQAPTPDEIALISRTANRIAQAGVDYVGATPDQQTAIRQGVNLDLATLANLGLAHEIQAEVAFRQLASNVLSEAVAIAIKGLLAAVA